MGGPAAVGAGFGVFAILIFILYLCLLGVGIYCLVLFIKLARRGIEALDIHLAEKKNRPASRDFQNQE